MRHGPTEVCLVQDEQLEFLGEILPEVYFSGIYVISEYTTTTTQHKEFHMKQFKVILEHFAANGGRSAFTTDFVEAETKEEAAQKVQNSYKWGGYVKKVVRAYHFKDGRDGIDERFNGAKLVKKS